MEEINIKVPIKELQERVDNFQVNLQKKGIEGALLVQRADTLYFSGTAQNVHVYVPREGKPIVLAYRDFTRAQKESSWPQVIHLQGMSKIPNYILEAGLPLPKILGLELDVLPVNQYERYRQIFPDALMVDVSSEIRLQRAVKSQWEIERMEEAAHIQTLVFEYAKEVLHPGITEVELEGFLVAKARSLGHGGHTRMRGFNSEFYVGAITSGIRATGPNYFDGPVVGQGMSIAHPMGASLAEIQVGEQISIDMAIVVHGYQNDQTRILCMGPLPEELSKAYEVAWELEEKVRRALVPGRTAGEVYAEALSWVQENTPYEQNFMGYGASRVSFLGHGLGIDLDELPTISKGNKEVLKSGMVVAIEPKFVFPGLGSVGVEDTVVIEDDMGARFLSKSPRELFVLDV